MDTYDIVKKKGFVEVEEKVRNVGFRAPELDELSSLFHSLNVQDDEQNSNKSIEKSHISFFPPALKKITRIIVYEEDQEPPALPNLPDENQYTYKYVHVNEIRGNITFNKFHSDSQRGIRQPFYYDDELSEFFNPDKKEEENTPRTIMRIVPYSTEEEKIQKQQLITPDDRYQYKYLNTNTELMDLCLWGYYQNFLDGISIEFFENHEAKIPSVFFNPAIPHPKIEITLKDLEAEGPPQEPVEAKIERIIVTRKRQRSEVDDMESRQDETKRMRM
jgi:hypothetical protein